MAARFDVQYVFEKVQPANVLKENHTKQNVGVVLFCFIFFENVCRLILCIYYTVEDFDFLQLEENRAVSWSTGRTLSPMIEPPEGKMQRQSQRNKHGNRKAIKF